MKKKGQPKAGLFLMGTISRLVLSAGREHFRAMPEDD
jgi:hypothetical protein